MTASARPIWATLSAMVLAAPLLLRPFPDAFVNGSAALVACAGASALLVALLFWT